MHQDYQLLSHKCDRTQDDSTSSMLTCSLCDETYSFLLLATVVSRVVRRTIRSYVSSAMYVDGIQSSLKIIVSRACPGSSIFPSI